MSSLSSIAHEFGQTKWVIGRNSEGDDQITYRVPTAPLSFDVLRRHDNVLRQNFLQGWSGHTESADTSDDLLKDDNIGSGSGEAFERYFDERVEMVDTKKARMRFFVNAWACLSVVFGDIGTSPIYTLNNVLSYFLPALPTADDVIGSISLIIWSLILIVVLKYVVMILQTDYHGKGGVFALISMLFPAFRSPKAQEFLVFLGCLAFGAMIADGALVPAISVLSALEAVLIPAPSLGIAFTNPVAIGILIVLFLFQRCGTEVIVYSFSPIMFLWYIILFGFGVYWVVQEPRIFAAFNPWLGINFLIQHGVAGWLDLAFVLLSLTGCEALYADRGHFGANPIRVSWFLVVFPALIMSYLGQGSLLLIYPSYLNNPFYNMVQGPLFWPVFAVSLLATIIASQSLLTAVFSLVQQGMSQEICPRLKMVHTSEHEEGQVFQPAVNFILAILCIGVVIGFQKSANITSSFGLSVACIMFQTSVLFCVVLRRLWHWNVLVIILIMAPIMFLEFGFMTAAFAKVPDGAWFTVVTSAIFCAFFYMWHRGRVAMAKKISASYRDIEDWMTNESVPRVLGCAVFLTPYPIGVPQVITTYAERIKVLPAQIIIMAVRTVRVAHISINERFFVENAGNGMVRVFVTLGFRDNINVVELLREIQLCGFKLSDPQLTFIFESVHTIPDARSPWYHRLMMSIFGAVSLTEYPAQLEFKSPSKQTVLMGRQLEC